MILKRINKELDKKRFELNDIERQLIHGSSTLSFQQVVRLKEKHRTITKEIKLLKPMRSKRTD